MCLWTEIRSEYTRNGVTDDDLLSLELEWLVAWRPDIMWISETARSDYQLVKAYPVFIVIPRSGRSASWRCA